MPYSSQSDISGEIGAQPLIELTDDEGLGTVNAGRVTAAITNADAEIDSYLAQRYAVPSTVGLTLLRDLSINLALERLYGRRPGSLPADRKDRIDAGRKLLADLAAGRAVLGDAPASQSSGPAAVFTQDRVFTRETLKGF